MLQRREPEQPDTPPEYPPFVDYCAEQVRKDALRTETQNAIGLVRQILVTGKGILHSYDSLGRRVDYDAGDLWDVLTENEESGDLRIFAGLGLDPSNRELQQQCDEFLGARLGPFLVAHCELVADQAERVFLAGERRV